MLKHFAPPKSWTTTMLGLTLFFTLLAVSLNPPSSPALAYNAATSGSNSSHQPRTTADIIVTTISAGYEHSCAVRSDGTVACWGDNSYGQSSPPPGSFIAVSADHKESCGLKSDHSLACWGTYYYTYYPSGLATGPAHQYLVDVDTP